MRPLACLVALLLAAPLCAADWPRLLGPAGDGHSPETGLLKSWTAAGPAKLWEHKLGSGYAGPAVARGKLIVFHRIGDEEIVECLDARTGAESGNMPRRPATSMTSASTTAPEARPRSTTAAFTRSAPRAGSAAWTSIRAKSSGARPGRGLSLPQRILRRRHLAAR